MMFRALPFLFALALMLAGAGRARALQLPPDAARAATQGLPLTPQMFGAKGNGTLDDTRAIATWLGSGHPLFCAGTFRLARAVAVDVPPDGGLSLHGAGRQLCKFLLVTPEAGIAIHAGTPNFYDTPQVIIHDIGVAAVVTPKGPALTIAYTGGSGSTDPTVDLRDVVIRPAADGIFVPTCLVLDNIRNGIVQGINCQGSMAEWRHGSRGIVIKGDSQPTEISVRESVTYITDIGIAIEGTWQGVSITESACVACRVGVRATASDDNGAWLRVLDSHFNVEDFGIEAVNIVNVHATGNFILLDEVGVSEAPYHACFSLRMLSQATQWAKVSGNACDGTQLTKGPSHGVFIDSARKPGTFLMDDRIDGNTFYALDDGIFLANATSVHIGSNTFSVIRKSNVINHGVGRGVFESTQPAPEVGVPQDGP